MNRWVKAAPATLVLAALATLPPDLFNDALGYDMMAPQGYLAEILWFPVFTLCQLALLRALHTEGGSPPLTARMLASALGAELLLGLRFCAVILLWALPSIVLLSIFGLEPVWARCLLALSALLGAIPCIAWILRRLFTPAIVLWQGLNASEAIAESARLSQGKLKKLLVPLLILNGIGLILEGIGSLWEPFSLISLPLSFVFGNFAIIWAWRILTL